MRFDDYKKLDSKMKEYIIFMIETNAKFLTLPSDAQVNFLKEALKHKKYGLEQQIEKGINPDRTESLKKELEEVKSMFAIFDLGPNTLPNMIQESVEELNRRISEKDKEDKELEEKISRKYAKREGKKLNSIISNYVKNMNKSTEELLKDIKGQDKDVKLDKRENMHAIDMGDEPTL